MLVKSRYFSDTGDSEIKAEIVEPGSGTASQSASYDFALTSFNIGILGKYPIAINNKLTLFPALGIDYQYVLSAKLEDEDWVGLDGSGVEDFNALWFKFGGGLDYALKNNVYLRFEALYGFRLGTNKAEEDIEKYIKAVLYEQTNVIFDTKTLLGHGLTAKLAVGYKL